MNHTGHKAQRELTFTGCWLVVISVKGIVFWDSSNINYLVVTLGMFVWLPSEVLGGFTRAAS